MKKNYPFKIFSIVVLFFGVVWANEGTLSVITDPPGVEIWVGENFIGNSPVNERRLPAGRYNVRIVDPVQRISHSEQVVIEANRSVMLEKNLARRYGKLEVNSEPKGAEVFLTVPLGTTPVSNDFIIPGQYLVEIRYPDQECSFSTKNVVVREGQSAFITDTLKLVVEEIEEEPQKLFTPKAWARIGLGVGALAGMGWAIYENGLARKFRSEFRDNRASSAEVRRNIGIITGSVCVLAFEIIAFF
ncbi:PEGA domain-containing protein [Chitinispirillales bacterium ANBcel5]|uniref:PEGA domain-containing protein n=1 Tax=Cellulosispirillum alkaliphilum TaxID=3039283 RepID=UPI002A53446F|nr:PEGA domain-containing protein [Chitinispirillales bacterium ANBcel5]